MRIVHFAALGSRVFTLLAKAAVASGNNSVTIVIHRFRNTALSQRFQALIFRHQRADCIVQSQLNRRFKAAELTALPLKVRAFYSVHFKEAILAHEPVCDSTKTNKVLRLPDRNTLLHFLLVTYLTILASIGNL